MPAFHKEKYGKFTHKQLLKSRFLQLERLWPKAGQQHHWIVGNPLQWRKAKAKPTFAAGDGKMAKVAYLATYIEVDRYTEIALKLHTHQRVQIFLNGKYVGGKASCTKAPKPKKGKKGKQANPAKKAAKKVAKAAARKAPAARRPGAKRPTPRPAAPGVMGQLARLLAQQGRIIEQQNKTISKQSRWLAQNAPEKEEGQEGQEARQGPRHPAAASGGPSARDQDPLCPQVRHRLGHQGVAAQEGQAHHPSQHPRRHHASRAPLPRLSLATRQDRRHLPLP